MTDLACLAAIAHRPWHPIRWHCWHVAAYVQRHEFGRVIPSPPRDAVRRKVDLLAAGAASGAWVETDPPGHGDIVLMGKRPDELTHVGVWIAPDTIVHLDEAHALACDPAPLVALVRGYRYRRTYRPAP